MAVPTLAKDQQDPFAVAKLNGFQNFQRGMDFWRRAVSIYGAYKATQLKALVLRRVMGKTPDELKTSLWHDQHTWAGEQMYNLAIDLRGFYLKAGQFIGARTDFIPEQICRRLCLLNDKVPPMSAEQARACIQHELGVSDLAEVFEWIDLEEPLGSASISQVHKGQLRRFTKAQLKRLWRQEHGISEPYTVQPGDTAWDVCNEHGISLSELAAVNKVTDLDSLRPGQVIKLPVVLGLQQLGQLHGVRAFEDQGVGFSEDVNEAAGSVSGRTSSSGGSSRETFEFVSSDFSSDDYDSSSTGSSSSSWPVGRSSNRSSGRSSRRFGQRRGSSSNPYAALGIRSSAAAAVAHAMAAGKAPGDGLVAVKIQYPDAQAVMETDLVNLRAACVFLSKTEIAFDLVSAVDELKKQIRLEFDFTREARVMDTIAEHLRPLASKVTVPRSIPGMVTKRMLTMTFAEGLPLLQLKDRVHDMPKWKRDKASRAILSNISQAYGSMILGHGLFQADGHPGNILVQRGGRIALLDYGQSKQLPVSERTAFAKLIMALHKESNPDIDASLHDLGVRTAKPDTPIRCRMAYGMFDTRGKVNPFDRDSPIKQCAITSFPPDMFFVLRVVQLLRGLAQGMDVSNFSSADQWADLARKAVKEAERAQKAKVPPAAPKQLLDVTSPLQV